MTEPGKFCVDCEKADACEARFFRAVFEILDLMREIRDGFKNTGGTASAVPVGAIEVCIGRTAHFEDDDGREHL